MAFCREKDINSAPGTGRYSLHPSTTPQDDKVLFESQSIRTRLEQHRKSCSVDESMLTGESYPINKVRHILLSHGGSRL